eukprot:SAG11_NODE_767_length_7273_cov_3.106914_6_plen_113_part_00
MKRTTASFSAFFRDFGLPLAPHGRPCEFGLLPNRLWEPPPGRVRGGPREGIFKTGAAYRCCQRREQRCAGLMQRDFAIGSASLAAAPLAVVMDPEPYIKLTAASQSQAGLEH